MSKSLMHVAVCGALLAAGSAQAADADQTQASAGMEEVLVTAQRKVEKLVDVPLTVTALSGNQLAIEKIQDTRSLAYVTPGLTFSSQGAWAEPNLRGISTGNSGPGQESPVAIYVDGVYQVSQVASIFDLPDVSQIEVSKGPQGTLFGRNAEGGAIQIHTKDPSLNAFTGNVGATFGYFTGSGTSRTSPEYRADGFLSAPFNSKVAGSVSFYARKIDGYLDNVDTGKKDGRVEGEGARAKLLIEPNDDIKILAAGWYSHTDDQRATAPNAFDGVSVLTAIDPNTGMLAWPGAGPLASRPWQTAYTFPQFVRTTNWGLSLKLEAQVGPGTLTSLTAYQNTHNNARVAGEAAALPPGATRTACFSSFSCIDYQALQPAKSISEEITYVTKLDGPLNFTGGAFFFRSDENQEGYVNQDVLPNFFHTDNRVISRSYAGFIEANYKPIDKLSLILGGRFTHEEKDGSFAPVFPGPHSPTNSGDWNSFTPRASIIYAVAPSSNVYFTFSEGFKSGVLNLTAPFDLVSPEKLYAYEVGFKTSQGRYTLEASAFHYDYRNVQVQIFNRTSGVTTNAAAATIDGLDVDARALVTPELQLRASASYLPHAKYDKYQNVLFHQAPALPAGLPLMVGDASGQRILKTPKLTATFSATYTKDLAWGTLAGNAVVYHSDSYFWEPGFRIKTKAYETVNASVSFTPRNSNFDISLWVKNLTNDASIQSYLDGGVADNATMYNPPREVGVTVQYAF
jgi:iron complex outermembrane receptor protein